MPPAVEDEGRASIPTFGADAIFEPLPPIAWRVEGLKLAPGGTTMFAGYGYSKKTLAAQSLGLSCAAGVPVFGVYRAPVCRVLHLDYEQGRRLTFERYQRLARAMQVEAHILQQGDLLRVAVFPAVYLDSPNAEDTFARLFDGYGLVVVDSLRASAPGADENSSEVRRLIDILNRASDKTGALPMLLHHARKPSDQDKGGARMSIRGSSAIFDAVQSMFVFEGEKGQPTIVHHEKERLTGVELPDFGLRTEDVAIGSDARGGLRIVHLDGDQLDHGTGTGSGELDRYRMVREKVLNTIASVPDLKSANGIWEVTKGSRPEVLAAVKILREEGRIVKGDDGCFRVRS